MAQFSYDSNGWFSGGNAHDIAAGRVTDVDPCVVDGGPAARWTGTMWDSDGVVDSETKGFFSWLFGK